MHQSVGGRPGLLIRPIRRASFPRYGVIKPCHSHPKNHFRHRLLVVLPIIGSRNDIVYATKAFYLHPRQSPVGVVLFFHRHDRVSRVGEYGGHVQPR